LKGSNLKKANRKAGRKGIQRRIYKRFSNFRRSKESK
jgi:hypothetical protein